MRQIAGVFAQLEKARLVSKLKGAREHKRALGLKVEGRKSYAEVRPEVVALARQLHRKRPKSGQRSLREIADEADEGRSPHQPGQALCGRCRRQDAGPVSSRKVQEGTHP
jgi:DNA invertase Pin-like site-specific DNA recombinase